MNEAKHTPGPWRACGDSVKAGSRFNVCPCVTAGGSAKGMIDEREVTYANARLIAAAPDLLAALRAAKVRLQFAERHIDCADELATASAAIAKATGEPG